MLSYKNRKHITKGGLDTINVKLNRKFLYVFEWKWIDLILAWVLQPVMLFFCILILFIIGNGVYLQDTVALCVTMSGTVSYVCRCKCICVCVWLSSHIIHSGTMSWFHISALESPWIIILDFLSSFVSCSLLLLFLFLRLSFIFLFAPFLHYNQTHIHLSINTQSFSLVLFAISTKTHIYSPTSTRTSLQGETTLLW